MKITEIIKYPVLTEKSEALKKQNKYLFVVNAKANKSQVRHAFQTMFEIKVDKVNIMKIRPHAKKVGKFAGFTSGYKKVVITLPADVSLGVNES